MKQIFNHQEDYDALALGAAILGSGGGGTPSYNRLITQYMVSQMGPVSLLGVDDLSPDDVVIPVAFMGAPLVGLEKIASGKEFKIILQEIERYFGKKRTVLVSAEIGGGNAFVAQWVGAMMQLPVLDGDLIGRAFPQLQMNCCTLHHIPAAPLFMADAMGNHAIVQSDDSYAIERMARQLAISMGSRAAVALHIMSGAEAKQAVVAGSVTRALSIGRAIQQARKNKKNPTAAILNVVGGQKLISATLVDVDHQITGGFLNGTATLYPGDGEERLLLHYQNEYLLATQEGKVLATTPDLLMLVEQGTGTPITSDALCYGLRVDLIAFPSSEIWRTTEGLKLVGPRAFGYSFDYQPIESKK